MVWKIPEGLRRELAGLGSKQPYASRVYMSKGGDNEAVLPWFAWFDELECYAVLLSHHQLTKPSNFGQDLGQFGQALLMEAS